MTVIEALWLGIVQGLTEFFPVSSSGHLVMMRSLLGVAIEDGIVFEIAVHVATLVAVAAFYRRRLMRLAAGVLRWESEELSYLAKLVIGTLPAVAVGLFAKDWISEQFSNPLLVGISLLITGSILWTTRWTTSRARIAVPTYRMALWVGCAQAFAILPGISRSGTTVAVALALGLSTAVAAEFSFLLGIIAIAGAAVLMLPELAQVAPEAQLSLFVGSAAALISGFAAISLFVRMLERQRLYYFAFYTWLAGSVFLLGLYVGL